MISLREIQENFQTYILLRDSSIQNHIAGPDVAFKQERLDVYKEGYALRLLEVLGKAFKGLHVMAGEELFDRLGREYIAEYPSNHFSVGYFGRHFSKFLASHIPSEPHFSEMAAFEWALFEVIDAPDAPHLTFEDMAKIPPESWVELCLVPHPSMQMLSFFYKNLPIVWQELKVHVCNQKCSHDEEKPPELERDNESSTWAVWRFNLQSYYTPLSKQQLWMLQALCSGKCFSEVCEGLCEWLSEDEVTQFAAENLRNWIVEGMFAEIKV